MKSRATGKPAIGPEHPDYKRWLEYFTVQALGANRIKIVLSIPKKVGRRKTRVEATLVDWSVVCGDPEIAAWLLELRPDSPGYLPPQTGEWARVAEAVLSARVDAIEGPKQSDTRPDGVVA
jgi:hypothetical protein